jgi:hypothetical protein
VAATRQSEFSPYEANAPATGWVRSLATGRKRLAGMAAGFCISLMGAFYLE